MFYVAVTTIMLIMVTITVSMDVPYNWVFHVTCLGQVMVAVMVHKVLSDNYTTDKTFEDFHEVYPIGKKDLHLL